jgi:predicted DNA-binding transcriptional regulator AlpA
VTSSLLILLRAIQDGAAAITFTRIAIDKKYWTAHSIRYTLASAFGSMGSFMCRCIHRKGEAMAMMKRTIGDLPLRLIESNVELQAPTERKPPTRTTEVDPLLTAEDVANRLNVSTDWVWDHSSRKKPFLPVIRMGDGTLRYRHSGIEAFIDERERVSSMGRRTG